MAESRYWVFSKVRPTICWARSSLVCCSAVRLIGHQRWRPPPFSSAPTVAEADAGAEATRSAMTSGTWARTVAAATAMPFFTAVSLEEPCPTMTAP